MLVQHGHILVMPMRWHPHSEGMVKTIATPKQA
jgi:hypothetical protein